MKRTILLFTTTLLAAPAWTPQSSGVTARLRGVSAVSERVAWASGAGGTILRTADSGQHWQRLAIPGAEKLDFRDIDGVDERTAYALSIGPGDASRIYKTTDAGANWQLQFTNSDPQGFFDAMAFWTSQRGVAIGDSVDGRFVILLTNDGGRTWTRVPAEQLPPALPGEGAFAASGTNVTVHGKQHVWIGTGSGRVLRSSDGGQHWQIAATGLAHSGTAGIFSIAFRDARNGIVVGGDYKRESAAIDNAAATDDGGRTWRMVPGLTGFRSVVAWLPHSKLPAWLAVGPSGADCSTDDGRTWQPVSGSGFHAFSPSPQGDVGWGVGESGRIGRWRW